VTLPAPSGAVSRKTTADIDEFAIGALRVDHFFYVPWWSGTRSACHCATAFR
jgi:hypothetical protein